MEIKEAELYAGLFTAQLCTVPHVQKKSQLGILTTNHPPTFVKRRYKQHHDSFSEDSGIQSSCFVFQLQIYTISAISAPESDQFFTPWSPP